jgi:HTH-type transcriptional regulator, glycine betaine synthesis regulator
MGERSDPRSAIDRFIESWGTLGSLWSINRSVARIQALLIASDEPLALDQIAERLGISRGNVSMSLRELLLLGLIERTNRAGDRRDFFSAPTDIWAMLFKIVRERNGGEFDPAAAALRDLLAANESTIGPSARARFTELERVFGTVQRILEVLLRDDANGRTMFGFFADLILREG